MSRERRCEARYFQRWIFAAALVLALAGILGGARAASAQVRTQANAVAVESEDQAVTGLGGAVSEETCPGGRCGTEALGDGREEVTEPGEITGDPRPDEECEGDGCGELPKAGDLGGITKDCPECVTREVPADPADDLGLNRSSKVAAGKAAAVAIPACQGNNHTTNAFNNNIVMGGPMVAIRWIPTSSVTIDAIDVFTGEVVAPNRLAIWSDDPGVVGGKPLAHLASTASWSSSLPNGWQGAVLSAPLSVTAGARYWVVWDPTGGEQASVQSTGIQQPYWGSFSGTVTGGASWFGPYSHPDHRWKFRMRCGNGPCDGNNDSTTAHLDNVGMGGPTVAIAWTPAVTGPITRIELYTGETTGQNQLALWSNSGGQPGVVLGSSNLYNSTFAKGWQGANLNTPVNVTAGTLYWVVWDPVGQQAPVQNTGIQQTYWGCNAGGATTCSSWNGPYSFTDRRWKFRVFCKDGPCDGNNHQNTNHLDPVLMGGPMVGIRWVPSVSNTISGVEVFTGEVAAPNAVGIWTDNAGQPGTALGYSSPFNTILFKSWQGATLNTAVNVVAGQTYWVVWDPSGGEQSSVDNAGIQQTYWGNSGGTVAGGGSWFGPFSFTDRRWKFRLLCGKKPCDGNNYANDNHLDNVSTGGPMIGIRWVPAATETLARIEVYTGEAVAANAIGIWSTTGGVNPQPLAPLAASAPWTSTLAKGWQGGDLLTPITVTGGTEYWVVWDPGSGQQSSLTGDPFDIQQTYWGSNVGTVGGGGASWFGPFSFPDRRYKFRMFCRARDCGPGSCISGSYCDSCQCYAPDSVISQTFCKCKLLNPACGIGECINGSYCTGPYCSGGVCYIPSHPISLAMCSGQALSCRSAAP